MIILFHNRFPYDFKAVTLLMGTIMANSFTYVQTLSNPEKIRMHFFYNPKFMVHTNLISNVGKGLIQLSFNYLHL